MRFTVGYCLYPHGENNSIETRMRLIFDDGLPRLNSTGIL